MKELLYFRLKNCPYCIKANKFLNELMEENEGYAKIPIKVVDERDRPDIAKRYDYWYVPCFYIEGTKVHEGVASKEDIKGVLDKALN